MKYIKIEFAIVLVVLMIISFCPASNVYGQDIRWQVISSGGATSTSPLYSMNGTVGQAAAGYSSSAAFGLSHGFWQTKSNSSCCSLRGDVAIPVDGLVLVNDIVFLVDYIFKGGFAPTCMDAADCAIPLDGLVLVNDIVWLVDYIFKGGPPPPAC